MIRSRYGTTRGLARLLLSYPQLLWLPRGPAIDVAAVRRLVFVCQGNICRSAYADQVAQGLGLESASFGLSAASGGPAHPPAVAAAALAGIDLAGHRTTRAEDYQPRPGDLLLAMEVRQLGRLARDPRLAGMPRTLLGLWAAPPRPHLHDPYQLDPAYMQTCLRVIHRAVERLSSSFPGAARG